MVFGPFVPSRVQTFVRPQIPNPLHVPARFNRGVFFSALETMTDEGRKASFSKSGAVTRIVGWVELHSHQSVEDKGRNN